MFVIKKEGMKVPVKIWAKEGEMEESAVEQIINASSLPFAFHHTALMPDGHLGYGAPIGGVLAAKGVIIPNFVGVDIGCGVCAVRTTLKVSEFDTDTLKKIMGDIRATVPVGFNHQKKAQDEKYMPKLCLYKLPADGVVIREYRAALKQVGTLGGGNHFIEIQRSDDGFVWIMIHSGSRNVGLKVANHYNDIAKAQNSLWQSAVPSKWDLAFLPADSDEGKAYIREMQYCVDFALANRKLMMQRIKNIFCEHIEDKFGGQWGIEFDKEINIAHNYAKMENHCSTCIDNLGNDNQIVESLLGVEAVTKVRDFLNGYRPVFHSCDGLILLKGASSLKLSPSQNDVLEQMIYECRSLNLGLELKHNHFSSFYPYEHESSSEIDKALNISENKFGLGFAHLFGVERDYHKWDRILGRIFLGYEAYNLDCKLIRHTSSIPHKHVPVQVMVHRKGATLAADGTIGIIPGSQGTASYIVRGLGNPDSFNSCSHGAGRKMGRKQATRELNLEEEIKKLNDKGVVHGIRNTEDLDEAAGAYKDVEEVIANQSDLVEITTKLMPMGVIKG